MIWSLINHCFFIISIIFKKNININKNQRCEKCYVKPDSNSIIIIIKPDTSARFKMLFLLIFKNMFL